MAVGVPVAPEASIARLGLVVVVVEPLSLSDYGPIVLHLRDGRYIEHHRVHYFRDVRRLRILCDGKPQRFNVDGELIEQTPADVSRAPDALRVFVPGENMLT